MKIDNRNFLHYEGERYHLTPQQAKIVSLLLEGRTVNITEIEDTLWPIDIDREQANPWITIRTQICFIRKRTPLTIRNVFGTGNYYLEMDMTDKPRPPEVDQAANRIQKSFGKSGGEGDFSDLGITTGPKTVEGDTVKIPAKGKGFEADIIIRPEKTDG